MFIPSSSPSTSSRASQLWGLQTFILSSGSSALLGRWLLRLGFKQLTVIKSRQSKRELFLPTSSRAQSPAAWAGDSGQGKAGQERTSGKPAPQRLQLCHADRPRTPGPSMSPWCCQAQPGFPPQPSALASSGRSQHRCQPLGTHLCSQLTAPLPPRLGSCCDSHLNALTLLSRLSLEEELMPSSSVQPSQTPSPTHIRKRPRP